MEEGHLTLGAGAWMETGAPQQQHSRAFRQDAPQPAAEPSGAYERPAPVPWSAPVTSDSYDPGFPETDTYERASGTTQAVEAIALALSRHHINSHTETSSSPAQNNGAVTASTTSISPMVDVPVLVDPSSQPPNNPSSSLPLESMPVSLPAMGAAAPSHESFPPPRSRSPTAPSHGAIERMRRADALSASQELLLENMICSGTQCNVSAPPLSNLISTGAGLTRTGGEGILEVDNAMTGDDDFEIPAIKEYLEARRARRPAGIVKNGLLPAYRSSTDTALRCHNLVRNVPRMRKRTKIRKKENLLGILPGPGPPAASTTTAS